MIARVKEVACLAGAAAALGGRGITLAEKLPGKLPSYQLFAYSLGSNEQ
jgi:hypothetical protein